MLRYFFQNVYNEIIIKLRNLGIFILLNIFKMIPHIDVS